MKKLTNYFLAFFYLGIILSVLPQIIQGKLPINLGMDLSGGVIVSYRPDFSLVGSAYSGKNENEIMQVCKDIITDRLQRKLNISPDVFINNNNNLVVNIPSVKNYDQVLDIVGKTYRLNFRLVLEEFADSTGKPGLFQYEGSFYRMSEPYFTGDQLDLGSIDVNPPDSENPNSCAVSFTFKPPHNREFSVFTKNNIGKQLAILLDNEVELAPVIRGSIEGNGQITGGYTMEEAKNTAILLQSGALPVSLEVESLSEIGPSLGESVRQKGATAVLLSIILFIVFIFFAYSGRVWLMVNGVLSLLFLSFMMILIMAALHITLDFYAIAGLILSIGISMDAFIIIFENFESSLNNFTPNQIALFNDKIVKETYSFKKEGRILFHSIISTFVVISMILFADRVKYFAVSMVAGSLASILTILFTRKMLLLTKRMAPYHGWSILDKIRDKKFGIFRFKRTYLILTIIAIIASSAILGLSFFSKTKLLHLGADFKPGTQVTIDFDKSSKESLNKLLTELKDSFPNTDIKSQEIKLKSNSVMRQLITINMPIQSSERGMGIASVDTTKKEIGIHGGAPSVREDSLANPRETESMITRAFLSKIAKANNATLLSINSIDSKLSASRFFTSISIFVLSFLFVGLYLFVFQGAIDSLFMRGSDIIIRTHRHEWAAWGIFLALIHDFSFMIITCWIFQIDIDLTIVAAIISVIGYSVNDSIVLWAHIQNMANKSPGIQPQAIVSSSIDSILSRSILTSIATMIPIFSIFILNIQELIPFAIVILIGTFFGALSSIYIVGHYALKTLVPKIEKTLPVPDEIEYLSDEEIQERLNRS